MKALGFCRDRELLKHLIGTDRIYVYLFGNVAVLAKSDHDVNRFLYATSLPKKIPLEEIENLYCNAASIAVSRLYGEDIVVVSDIGSNDYAVVIAHRLAQQLESLSPFAV
ncbi:MAG TPA: hypothetical protein ENF93_02440, partial [Ignisphaera sp.]|nr:hypothetical protein [Ignisphaera sp.]